MTRRITFQVAGDTLRDLEQLQKAWNCNQSHAIRHAIWLEAKSLRTQKRGLRPGFQDENGKFKPL